MSDRLTDLQIDKSRSPLGGVDRSQIEDARKHGAPKSVSSVTGDHDVAGGKTALDPSTPIDLRGVHKTYSPMTPGKAPGTKVNV